MMGLYVSMICPYASCKLPPVSLKRRCENETTAHHVETKELKSFH